MSLNCIWAGDSEHGRLKPSTGEVILRKRYELYACFLLDYVKFSCCFARIVNYIGRARRPDSRPQPQWEPWLGETGDGRFGGKDAAGQRPVDQGNSRAITTERKLGAPCLVIGAWSGKHHRRPRHQAPGQPAAEFRVGPAISHPADLQGRAARARPPQSGQLRKPAHQSRKLPAHALTAARTDVPPSSDAVEREAVPADPRSQLACSSW